MSELNYITSYCTIETEKVVLNGDVIFTGDKNITYTDFMKSVYKNFLINYPKFYKMDNLCKLAFITSELLLKTNSLKEKYKEENIAIIVANSTSSLDSDTEHQSSISDKNNYFPSPAVFVYTLANILIGEIAIRNSIKGENSLFIFENFNPEFMSNYSNILLARKNTEACISGYVDCFENNYKAFLYTVEKIPGIIDIEHTPDNLTQLFNK